MKKKLSVAFLWHMHQPVYQDTYEGTFYMPWVRLHAVKDYLDMLYIMDKYPKLKLNFNLSPTILKAFEKYADGYDDIHSALSSKPVEELTDKDKMFILNYFFDANYSSMIMHHAGYDKLYKKRNSETQVDVNDFTLQEYSDIMFWFNLAWMDPTWQKHYPKLKALEKKGKDYTLEDRQYLISVQREIISKIVPSYKKYQDDGKIEISTNPLYHPILPLLIDVNVAKNSTTKYGLPNCSFNMKEDAKAQIAEAIELYEELFGKKPNGMWPSELSVSKDMLSLFSDAGIKWTITDESILAESINREFVKDNRGNMEDPYHLSHAYKFDTENGDINIFFRNSVMANLIGFEYPNYDSVHAANDLYDRIKHIQDKLQASPDKNHIVVIAMDGENSWENYPDDGNKFLDTLYSLITNDETLETETLSSYIKKSQNPKSLNNIAPGSWINRNFQLWIAEPTKNKAWECLTKVRADLLKIDKQITDPALRKTLWKELYVAEGSDWFWWFGEPNDSGQDNLFDYLFRKHLQNIYELVGMEIPEILKEPLISLSGRPSRFQKAQINPTIDGDGCSDEWNNAGCIDLPSGPLSNEHQILTKICYGVGNQYLYLKMDINHYSYKKLIDEGKFYQVYVYIKNKAFAKSAKGKLRVVMRPEMISPILKENFSHEIKLTFEANRNIFTDVAYSNKEGLWLSKLNNKIECKMGSVIEARIPLTDIDLNPGDSAEFLVVEGTLGRGKGVYPRDIFLPIENIRQEELICSNKN